MNDYLAILEVLHGVKLLPRRSPEKDIVYGYVKTDRLASVVAQVVDRLSCRGYEVHQCSWSGDTVLLALNGTAHPLALRLTSSSTERYNLYTLSRPQDARELWQWAQAMAHDQIN